MKMEFAICVFSTSTFHAVYIRSVLKPTYSSTLTKSVYSTVIFISGASYFAWKAVVERSFSDGGLHCPSCLLVRGCVLGGSFGTIIPLWIELITRWDTKGSRLNCSAPRNVGRTWRNSITPLLLGSLGMYLADRSGRLSTLRKNEKFPQQK